MSMRALLRFGLALTALSCSSEDSSAPDGATPLPAPDPPAPSARRASQEVFYFLLPDRFANGSTANDTGGIPGGVLAHGFKPTDKGYYNGGDLPGLIGKLDYIKGLGVTAIWMGPIFKNWPVQGNGTEDGSSAGYHGYWTIDYTKVDPHFGTNEDLTRLVEGARARGIKVFFDIIVNHTADIISYREGVYSYRNKTAFPYRDARGRTFDDRDYAASETFPELDPETSFPSTPVFSTPGYSNIKVPAWLNDPTMYHNRGETTFTGEDSLYGDFFGLDDLFTERPEVVRGMIDIHKQWIRDFGIDGFRVDTARHVNDEFWQAFVPEITSYAASVGKPDFFMFGEVSDPPTPEYLSRFTSVARFPAVLDFAFQTAARGFASRSGRADALAELFAGDDFYIDRDSNAYGLPTFLGNHDMGRFGFFLKTDNPGANDAELLARDKLGHALMFFARGMPVVYYGDEQGFTGDGNDKDARDSMFASKVPTYRDNDLIGTAANPTTDNYVPQHVLYKELAVLSSLRAAHAALRTGAQVHRLASLDAGVYAFSRVDRDEQIEYVVALNNAEVAKTVVVPTYMAATAFQRIYPAGAAPLTSDADKLLSITVPPLAALVYRADAKLPPRRAAPKIAFVTPTQGSPIRGRKELRVDLKEDLLAEVTFWIRKSSEAEWTQLGTDDNAPYRVFYDTAGLAAGTQLHVMAAVRDYAGNTSSVQTIGVVGN